MFVEVDSLTAGCLQLTFGASRFMVCYDGTGFPNPKGLAKAGFIAAKSLAAMLSRRTWSRAMFAGVFACRPSVEAGWREPLAVLDESPIHDAMRHLQLDAHTASGGQWHWDLPAGKPAFHLCGSRDLAGCAGTLMGDEGLDNLTKTVHWRPAPPGFPSQKRLPVWVKGTLGTVRLPGLPVAEAATSIARRFARVTTASSPVAHKSCSWRLRLCESCQG